MVLQAGSKARERNGWMGAKEAGLERAKKFVLDSGAKEEHEGQESHGPICHVGSSMAGVLRGWEHTHLGGERSTGTMRSPPREMWHRGEPKQWQLLCERK